MERVVYVVGLQQSGGAWLWKDEFFQSEEETYAEQERLVRRGLAGVKVFHLYLKKAASCE